MTHDFGFLYMQEAFVAALLAIASMAGEHHSVGDLSGDWVNVLNCDGDDDNDNLDHYVLRTEMKKQIKILRDGMSKDE